MLKFGNIKKDDYQPYLRLFKGGRGEEGGRFKRSSGRAWIIFLLFIPISSFSQQNFILKAREISGKISPKSVVTDGRGHFAAQNMMYRHCITFYNAKGELLKRLSDKVVLPEYGFLEYDPEPVLGAPVEAVYSSDGEYIYVSNYAMEGEEFSNPGCDGCIGSEYDNSFIYKIRTSDYSIENVIEVGAVPKFLALSNNDSLLLASNWTSSNVSIVDAKNCKEIKRINVGAHPRGIEIDSKAEKAYVTIMGSSKIAVINLMEYTVEYIANIGKSPRHLCLTANDSLLYVAVNSSNAIVKYNLITKEKTQCKTNSGPRSMILSPDEKTIYVVNYFANTFSKINTDNMVVQEVQETNEHPIGIAANWETSEIWVACYVGLIEIHKDFELASRFNNSLFSFDQLNELIEEFTMFTGTNNERDSVVLNETISILPLDSENIDSAEELDTTNVATLVPKLKISQGSKLNISNLPKKKVEEEVSNDCDYHVITGTFSVYENAQKRGEEIKVKGYNVELISGKSGVTYVSAKCFVTRESANKSIQKIFEDTGVKGWVLKY